MNIFAARLVNLRKGKGITQDELADALHTAHSTISMIEAGTREPSKQIAKKLADYFQVPVELFLYKEDAQTPSDTQKMVTTAEVLLVADIVAEYFRDHGYEITPEQRNALVGHFYRQNLRDAEAIKQQLSVLAVMNSFPKRAS